MMIHSNIAGGGSMIFLFGIRSCTVLLACLVFLMSGCGSGSNIHKFSQAQLTALTTREVQASFGDTYKAATDAMFDAGYTIEESDRDGGILTGIQGKDQSAARFWVSPLIRDTVFRISVLLREVNTRSTTVRLSTSRNAEPYIDEKAIDQFWRLMERQVLMKAPPPVEN